MAKLEAKPVWTGKATLGEGPLWVPRLERVLFVDIKQARLLAWSPADNSTLEWKLPEACCWLIERTDGEGFLAGLKTRIVRLKIDARSGPHVVAEVARPEAHLPRNRFNDAKADPYGRVWAGSMEDAETGEVTGALYRIDPDGKVTRADAPYGVANGPAISTDGRTLYHTDSMARTIYAFDLGADGSLKHKRNHIVFEPADGYPDGMTIDAEGYLWVAHWAGARVTRFTPKGKVDRTIAVPCSQVTSCVFYGKNLDRMAITSAAINKEHEPLAGSLFTVDPGVRGLLPATFG